MNWKMKANSGSSRIWNLLATYASESMKLNLCCISVTETVAWDAYRKSPDRSPRLLSVQFALTPGLYPGPGVYPGPGFYRNMYKALILGYRIVHMC